MIRFIAGLAIATGAASASPTAMAQAYLGAAGGKGAISVECAGLSSCDKHGDAYRFVAGYRFDIGIAPEFGISDFGSAEQRSSSATVITSVTAYTLGVSFDAPLGRWAGFTSRVGVARLTTERNWGFAHASDNNTAPYLGVGFYVAPWQNIRIELSYDRSRAEFYGDKGDVGAVLLGARVRF